MRWGRWELDAGRLVLTFSKQHHSYEVDLERCCTPAQMLDWIFQVRPKGWCSIEDIADLIDAFNDLLDPQKNLCSGGLAKRIPSVRKLVTDSL